MAGGVCYLTTHTPATSSFVPDLPASATSSRRYLTSLFLTCLSIYEDGDGRERCWLVVNGYISSAKTRTVF